MAELPERDRLRAFVLRFIQQGTMGDSVTVEVEHQDAFLVLFGVLQRVRRLANGYMRLSRAGFGNEGHVLVRAALEHSVTAQWVFYANRGVERLQVEIARDRYTLAKTVANASPEQLKAFKDAIPKGKGMPTWSQIVSDLDDDTRFVSQTYRVLSQAVHVTQSASVDALDFDDDGNLSVVMFPEAIYEHEVLYALAGCCMLASWLFAVIEGDRDEQGRLQSIGQDLHVPWTLVQNLDETKRRVVPQR